jgi:hypothetical protein
MEALNLSKKWRSFIWFSTVAGSLEVVVASGEVVFVCFLYLGLGEGVGALLVLGRERAMRLTMVDRSTQKPKARA